MNARTITLAALCVALLEGPAGWGATPEQHTQGGEKSGKGWMGISIQDMTPRLARAMDLRTERGALITDVARGSPAETAGLKDEDIITKFGDREITDADDVRSLVRGTAPGSSVTVVFLRKGEKRSATVKIGRMPKAMAAPLPLLPAPRTRIYRFDDPPPTGLTLRTLRKQLGKYFQAPDGRGVLVEEVEEESDAAAAGFRAGDVITRIGGEQVEEVRDVRRALRNADAGDTLHVEVLRRGSPTMLTLTLPERTEEMDFRFHSDSEDLFELLDPPDLDGLQLELERIRPQMNDLRRDLQQKLRHRWALPRCAPCPGKTDS